eukprot:12593420-Alexandrium_andersonii.AAC.1
MPVPAAALLVSSLRRLRQLERFLMCVGPLGLVQKGLVAPWLRRRLASTWSLRPVLSGRDECRKFMI